MPPSSSEPRTDHLGRAFAGSQLQIQLYVNRRRGELNEAIRSALGLSHLRDMLAAYWPEGGPRWDGLAVVNNPARPDCLAYLLVEAKSYPQELFGPGCRASDSRSKQMIEAALRETKAWAGVDEAGDWEGSMYQYANRLAHMFFLQQRAGLQAWLINLCFLNDPHRPTPLAEWESSLATIKQNLGFKTKAIPLTADVFLPARERSEFLTED